MKRQLHDLPSVQLGYIAALSAAAGHEVVYTEGAQVDGDVALVLTSLVDHKNEAAWADAQRRRGMRVGFIGLTASKLPELFEPHGDFVILGEPETAVDGAGRGRARWSGRRQPGIADLDTLPFPRWDIVRGAARRWWSPPFSGRPVAAPTR